MKLENIKAFTPAQEIGEGTFFVSDDVRKVVKKGLQAARGHQFMVVDAPPGSGASLALNVLKAKAKADPSIILIELSPYPLASSVSLYRSLWSEVLLGLGVTPAWRWKEWVDAKKKRHQGRQLQLRDKLAEIYEAKDKSVLICMDNALSQPRYLWQCLRLMADLNCENKPYGPGVVLVANLADKVARYKPEDIVEEGKKDFPPMARRVSFKLGGLNPEKDEVAGFVRFHAAREGKPFHPQFLLRLHKELGNTYLEASGKHRLPGTINAVGRNLVEFCHERGYQVFESRAARRPSVAKLKETVKV